MGLEQLQGFCERKGFALSDEQVRLFEAYLDALYRMNEQTNLTRVSREDAEVRHLVDSLLVAEFVPQGASVLDVGSGPGLPAWPLACARPDLAVTAMDSSGKMLRVLQETSLPNLRIKQHRAEEPDERESYEFVTGRAVAPLAVQLEVSAPWVKVGGCVVPFRTPNDNEAIESLEPGVLGLRLENISDRALLDTEIVRVLPLYRKVRETPPEYPRTWAQIKKRPISSRR